MEYQTLTLNDQINYLSDLLNALELEHLHVAIGHENRPDHDAIALEWQIERVKLRLNLARAKASHQEILEVRIALNGKEIGRSVTSALRAQDAS